MNFIVDECTGPRVVHWLRGQGHDVISIFEQARGATDLMVLEMAVLEKRVLITNDKDFGEMVFKDGLKHMGVVLLRLKDETPKNKIRTLERLIKKYLHKLPGKFVVCSESQVRFSSSHHGGSDQNPAGLATTEKH